MHRDHDPVLYPKGLPLLFCAMECQRQQKTEPEAIWRMFEAWRVINEVDHLDSDLIKQLARVIEPQNISGYRKVPATIANQQLLSHHLVARAMESLLAAIEEGDISPEDAYQEFETIHPFEDGNGRVGALVYNWMLDTLGSPVAPPSYKGNA